MSGVRIGSKKIKPCLLAAPARCLTCVNDMFQFFAVAVQTITDSFSRHEKLTDAV